MRKPLLLAFVLGGALSAQCQSLADLNAKYRTLKAYEVRPGIVMMPLFTANGQVCEMVVERHTIGKKEKMTIDFDSSLSPKAVRSIVDELVPPTVRGKELKGFENWVGSVIVDGPFVVTTYKYANVTVEVNRDTTHTPSRTVVVISWPHRICGEPQRSQSRLPSRPTPGG